MQINLQIGQQKDNAEIFGNSDWDNCDNRNNYASCKNDNGCNRCDTLQCYDNRNLFEDTVNNTYTTIWAKQLPKQTALLFWKEFQHDKLNPILFFDGEMENFLAFYAWLIAPDKDARFVVDTKGMIKALYWLNNPLGKSVMIHFCFLRHAFLEQEQIGRYVVEGLLFCNKNSSKNSILHSHGKNNEVIVRNTIDNSPQKQEYVLSALIGITPKCYRHALSFIGRLGFQLAAEVPEACYFARKNSYKTAVFSILTRELYQQAWPIRNI